LSKHVPRILVYGYGNPGRQDDGLGVIFTDELEKWVESAHLVNVHTDSNYQLNLEDAAGIANYDIVIFADASKEDLQHFSLVPLEPSEHAQFSMHSVSAAFILYLCHQIFNHKPKAYLLHIKGYKWDFMSQPSDKARENLDLALVYTKDFILNNSKPVA
jgi:hydrogenase maturation protease